jgi:hypothetical protein
MLRAEVYSKNIDCYSLVEMVMPHIEKGLSNTENPLYHMASRVISKNGKPSKFSKFILSVIPKKEDMLVSILSHFDDALVEFLNKQLDVNNIAAKIMSIKTGMFEGKVESMLKIEILIDEIDYGKTIDNLLPHMIQKLSEREDKSGKIGHILLDLRELPSEVMKAAIRAIPVKQRDALIAMILSEYKDEIADTLNAMIVKNNIEAEISDININSI